MEAGLSVISTLFSRQSSKYDTYCGADIQPICSMTSEIWSYFRRPEITLAAKLKIFCSLVMLVLFALPYTCTQ